jgi:hypothetical protein
MSLIGVSGETPNSGITADTGTVFLWYGAVNGTMVAAVNVRQTTFSGFCLDGRGAAAVTGLLYDSTDGSSAECEFTKFAIRECYIGVQWGTTGLSPAWAAQGVFRIFTIWSAVANSIGFVLNSGNVGQQCAIEHGGIQTQAIGIDIIVANLIQIRRVFGGTKMAIGFIRSGFAQDVLIEGCSSENWGSRAGSTWRSDDSYFLKVVPPVGGASSIPQFTITMIQNQINNPVLVTSPARILSVGDAWGMCEVSAPQTPWVTATVYAPGTTVSVGVRNYYCIVGHTSGVFATDLAAGKWGILYVNAMGTFTSGVSSLVDINNGIVDAALIPATNEPAHGWVDSAFVNRSGISPGHGWVTPPFNAGDFTASGAMTWTVAAGNVAEYAYTSLNRTMTVSFVLNATTVAGTPSFALQVRLPLGKVALKQVVSTVYISDNGVQSIGYATTNIGSPWIQISKVNFANFAASAGATQIHGQITLPL